MKFEQLEKSGTVTDELVALLAGGDVPCTTHVPSIEGVEEFPLAPDEVLVVGPSTVEVRSTPHAATATIRASELDRKENFFVMDVILGIGQQGVDRYLSAYTIVPGPTIFVRGKNNLKS